MNTAAGNSGARKRRATLRSSAAKWRHRLIGAAAVQRVFHFLHGPADVLAASTACSVGWRKLASADAVWRIKFKREGMEEKAGVFEVALPGAPSGGEGGGGSSAAEEEEEEAGGVGLALYAQVFALKVLRLRG